MSTQTKISPKMQAQKDRDTAALNKRFITKDALLELAWLAGAQAGLAEARRLVKQ